MPSNRPVCRSAATAPPIRAITESSASSWTTPTVPPPFCPTWAPLGRLTDVLCVALEDKPGELARVMGIVSDVGINVLYSYSLISTFIALSVKDLDEAECLLSKQPVVLVDQAALARPVRELRTKGAE